MGTNYPKTSRASDVPWREYYREKGLKHDITSAPLSQPVAHLKRETALRYLRCIREKNITFGARAQYMGACFSFLIFGKILSFVSSITKVVLFLAHDRGSKSAIIENNKEVHGGSRLSSEYGISFVTVEHPTMDLRRLSSPPKRYQGR